MSKAEVVATVLAIILVLSVGVAGIVVIRREYVSMKFTFLTPEEKRAHAALANAKQELKDARAAQADAERMLKEDTKKKKRYYDV